MAETIGALIITAVTATTSVAVPATILGVSTASIIGNAVILGAAIGLQYAFGARPALPDNGSQPLQQAVPPRLRGYGRCRVSGYYMLYEATNGDSYDVIAWHHGRAVGIVGMYLHDDEVFHNSDYPLDDRISTLINDGRYGDFVHIRYDNGAPSSGTPFYFSGTDMDGLFDPATHLGRDVAWLSLLCEKTDSAENFTRTYPRGLPVPSVVADLSPVWDPRDPAQSRTDPTTWRISYNPVVQLIDYLTRTDGGVGLDYDIIIGPVIEAWKAEADVCDAAELKADGTYEPRYESHGWFTFDNKPEDIINAILATCDGWMCEAGDGTLALKAGLYREPTVTIDEKNIVGFGVNYGQADEQSVNELAITYTSPEQKYVKVSTETLRDEDAISQSGVLRSQPLDLSWVHSNSQAQRLASRAMQRLNPEMTGTFVTTLYGLKALGERWVHLKYPFVSGLQDCVVEIQDAELDLTAGRITFSFRRVNVNAIEAYDPETDEGQAPPVPTPNGYATLRRESGTALIRENGIIFVRETV